MDLSGADVDNPRAAATFAGGLAAVLGDMSHEAGQFHGNQQADGVKGKPLDFLAAMQDAYATAAAALQAAADDANDQCNTIADTLGSDESVADTEDGGYASTKNL